MKRTRYTHHIIVSATVAVLFTPSIFADDTDTVQTPPSAEEISQEQQKLQIKTETIYETSFLPGVRFCEEDEVDYRGEFRKVNCQDEALINAVSTRKEDPYYSRPNTVIDDRIEPNGNIFRINFRRKASVVETTSDN